MRVHIIRYIPTELVAKAYAEAGRELPRKKLLEEILTSSHNGTNRICVDVLSDKQQLAIVESGLDNWVDRSPVSS